MTRGKKNQNGNVEPGVHATPEGFRCRRLGDSHFGLDALRNLVLNRGSYDLFTDHGSNRGSPLQNKVSSAGDS
jgi:hypothetical protein